MAREAALSDREKSTRHSFLPRRRKLTFRQEIDFVSQNKDQIRRRAILSHRLFGEIRPRSTDGVRQIQQIDEKNDQGTFALDFSENLFVDAFIHFAVRDLLGVFKEKTALTLARLFLQMTEEVMFVDLSGKETSEIRTSTLNRRKENVVAYGRFRSAHCSVAPHPKHRACLSEGIVGSSLPRSG